MKLTWKQCMGAIAFMSAIALGQSAHAALYAYWPLNEGAGNTTATFGVGGLAAGTVNNTATGGLGLGGNAWVLGDPTRGTVISSNGNDASGSYVFGGNIPAAVYNSNFTITGWVALQAAGTGGNDVVLGNRFGATGGQWAKLTQTNYEWSPGGNLNIPDLTTNGTWQQHTIVKNGSNIQHYLNGVPTVNGSFGNTFAAGIVPFFIGGDAGGERPGGLMDEVGFFNEALSDGKARAMYSLATTTQLQYDLLEIQQIYDAYDASGNAAVDQQRWTFATSAQLAAQGVLGGLGQVTSAGNGQRYGVLLDSTAGTGMLAFSVPEPASYATWGLMAAMLIAFGVVIQRRRRT
jgi:hypothetical protein